MPLLGAAWFGVMLGATFVHFAVAVALFVRRWGEFPISGHARGLVLVVAISGLMHGDVACLWALLFRSFPTIIFYNFLLARAWRLWYQYLVQGERVERQNALALLGSSQPSLSRMLTLTRKDVSRVRADTMTAMHGGPEFDSWLSEVDKSASRLQLDTANPDVKKSGHSADMQSTVSRDQTHSRHSTLTMDQTRRSVMFVSDAAETVVNDRAREKLERSPTELWDPPKRTFLARCRPFFSESGLMRTTWAVCAVQIFAICLSLLFVDAGDDLGKALLQERTGGLCPSLDLLRRTFQVIFGSYAIFAIATVWQMRRVYDNFHIKRELSFDIVLGLYQLAIGFASGLGLAPQLWRAMLAVFTNGVLFCMVTWKVVLSYKAERERKSYRAMDMVHAHSPDDVRSEHSDSEAERDDEKYQPTLRTSTFKTGFDSAFDSMQRDHVHDRRGSRLGGTLNSHHHSQAIPSDVHLSRLAHRGDSLGDLGSLEDVISDESPFLGHFSEFLKREFSVENLLFVRAARAFQQKCLATDAGHRSRIPANMATGSVSAHQNAIEKSTSRASLSNSGTFRDRAREEDIKISSSSHPGRTRDRVSQSFTLDKRDSTDSNPFPMPTPSSRQRDCMLNSCENSLAFQSPLVECANTQGVALNESTARNGVPNSHRESEANLGMETSQAAKSMQIEVTRVPEDQVSQQRDSVSQVPRIFTGELNSRPAPAASEPQLDTASPRKIASDERQSTEAEQTFRSMSERNRRAIAIYAEFVHEGGDSQVNLGARARKEIFLKMRDSIENFSGSKDRGWEQKRTFRSVKPVPARIFSEAEGIIYRLIERDSFARFKKRFGGGHKPHGARTKRTEMEVQPV